MTYTIAHLVTLNILQVDIFHLLVLVRVKSWWFVSIRLLGLTLKRLELKPLFRELQLLRVVNLVGVLVLLTEVLSFFVLYLITHIVILLHRAQIVWTHVRTGTLFGCTLLHISILVDNLVHAAHQLDLLLTLGLASHLGNVLVQIVAGLIGHSHAQLLKHLPEAFVLLLVGNHLSRRLPQGLSVVGPIQRYMELTGLRLFLEWLHRQKWAGMGFLRGVHTHLRVIGIALVLDVLDVREVPSGWKVTQRNQIWSV